MVLISSLSIGDSNIVVEAMIAHVNMGKNAKSVYLSITLQDASGQLDAKLWSATPEQVNTLVPGTIVEAKGDVIKYNDGLQMKVTKVTVKEVEDNYRYKFIKSSSYNVSFLEQEFISTINKIQDEEIFTVTSTLFNRYKKEFLAYPAASKNHHEYLSGLAEHTYGMLQLSIKLCELYPILDKDLMNAGILLHDIGKVVELSGPVVPAYTFEGKMIGHISIGAMMVDEVANEKNLHSRKITLLKHIILSHHGKMEYGSPVLPATPEAEMISMLDNIDAKMNMLQKAMDETEPGEFTKRIFPLDNRSFYKQEE